MRETETIDRTKYIGGSDAPAILGVDPWRTPIDVWEQKVGMAPEHEDNLDLKRGRWLEPWAIEEYMVAAQQQVEELPSVQHYEHDFIAGHPDGVILTDAEQKENGPGILEVKCPRLRNWYQVKQEGATDYMIVQEHHYFLASGWGWGDFAVFNDDVGLLYFRIEQKGELIARMLEIEQEFWEEYVVPGKRPPEEGLVDPESLDLPTVGGDLVRVDTIEWSALVSRLKNARELRDEGAGYYDAVKEEVSEFMMRLGVEAVKGGGATIYHRQQKGRTTFNRRALERLAPLDRLKVQTVLEDLMGPAGYEADVITALADCDVDFAQFERTGKPFYTLKPYFEEEAS